MCSDYDLFASFDKIMWGNYLFELIIVFIFKFLDMDMKFEIMTTNEKCKTVN